MGGMAAQIPIKNDESANEKAMSMVVIDKEREANAGHDGTWIAHPGLSEIALSAFNKKMPEANQIQRKMEDPNITAKDLLKVPAGEITMTGLRENIKVGIQYVEAWLRGNGCVPLYNLMEDAATAEISRAQIWQWIKNNCKTNSEETINVALFIEVLEEQLIVIKEEIGEDRFTAGKFTLATELFKSMIMSEDFDEFLTLPAYSHI